MTISIDCPNEDCGAAFSVNTDDFESQSESSGNHTTQYLETGSVNCPECETEANVEVLSDILNDTGEVLSQEVRVS
ncbi:hypothetical protein PUND_b0450 [Pseudoalteromonas undina]|uniref:Small CPxCG-related zinc finger protein n=1 Tax=Pseudoalteromonas undina TaxID=43660 RepID=A0ABP2XYQ5_9GAMM|nr:hypothetical protein [Pseudoalteromonas undina]KAF7763115.1 hypothetical protein PUND_b0450 [Pseudoalteromonas undina]